MKTVLIVAYYFPPSVDAGAKRALGFYRNLSSHGYHPLVLTVAGGNYLTVDGVPTEDGPDVFRARPRKPFLRRHSTTSSSSGAPPPDTPFRRLARRIYREVVYIPDGYHGFFRPACDLASRLMQQQQIDLLFTMTTPYTSLRVGYALNKRFGLPWVADFRDLWTAYHGGYPYSPVRRKIDEHLERKWVSRAQCLVTVGNGLKHKLQEQFPGKPAYAISNGYLEHAHQPLPPLARDTLRMVFTGTLYEDFDHSIRPLCEALECLRQQAPVAFSQLSVDFFGSVNRQFGQLRQRFGLDTVLQYRGRLGPDDIMRIQREADLLLLLLPEELADAIPTKTFEYLASGRPILLIGPPRGEAAQVVEATRSGRVFSPSQTSEIATFLLHLIDMKRTGDTIRSGVEPVAIQEFSYHALAGRLAKVFDSVCKDASSRV
jgi:glycosyltransferase involved in cell wall biosynthesis